jgi:hypothetical protein
MSRAWVIGLASVAVLTAAAAMIVLGVGSSMIAEGDAYFGQFDFSVGNQLEIDQVEYDAYTRLYARGIALADLTSPLLLCAVGAGVILLAVLAARRDAVGQTGAPAAS